MSLEEELPGVLLGVFEELSDTLADLPGDRPFKPDVLDELAFLCHLAIGPFVIGMSSFNMLWMSFSKPNCAIVFCQSLYAVKTKVSGLFFYYQ